MSAAEERIVESIPVEQTILQAVTKAELDQQITTARAYPRSLTKFMRECMDMATLNEQIAGECIYALPRDGKTIEGPSARLAEIVVSAWGNCRAGARVVDEGREFITAQGVFHDLERNSAITYEVKRRITNKRGDRYSSDMIAVTGNAACSIALRNAVFKGVPKAFWSGIYDAARKVIAGDSKTLVNRREQALGLLQKVGVTRDMVLAKLEISGTADIGMDEIVVLNGLYNAIRDNEITAEEAFAPKPDPNQPQPTGTKTQQAKDALRKGAPETAAAKEQPTGKVPHFDKDTAIAEIKKATTLKGLEEVYSPIVTDFVDTNRQVPQEVEGAYTDRKAKLEQDM